jgi:hypothetical protein
MLKRIPLIRSVISNSTKGTQMAITEKAVRDSLTRHAGHLKSSIHDDIVDGLKADGLIGTSDDGSLMAGADSGGKILLTPMQCAAVSSRHAESIAWIEAQCRRLGYTLPSDKKVSIAEFDRAVAGKDVDTRWALKTAMARMHLID